MNSSQIAPESVGGGFDASVRMQVDEAGHLILTYVLNGRVLHRRAFDVSEASPKAQREDIQRGLEFMGEVLLGLRSQRALAQRIQSLGASSAVVARPGRRFDLKVKLLDILDSLPAFLPGPEVATGTAQLYADVVDLAVRQGFVDEERLRCRRVLAIDREEGARALLWEVLGEVADEVEVVASPDEALLWLKDHSCEFLVTNVDLPGGRWGMDGLDLVKILRVRAPFIETALEQREAQPTLAEAFAAYEAMSLFVPFDYFLLKRILSDVFGDIGEYLDLRHRVASMGIVICTGFDCGARIRAVAQRCGATYVKKPFSPSLLLDVVRCHAVRRELEARDDVGDDPGRDS